MQRPLLFKAVQNIVLIDQRQEGGGGFVENFRIHVFLMCILTLNPILLCNQAEFVSNSMFSAIFSQKQLKMADFVSQDC